MKLPGIRETLLSPLAWGAVAILSMGSAASARDRQAPGPSGPQSDFPVTVGPAYQVGSTTFVPSDSMNFDSVGYAVIGTGDGSGIAAGHHTLPVPSYAEVTDIRSGRTILVRVDHRGPADASHAIELSPGAAAQLGLSGPGDVPVRVRRVNPPEAERALLRSGNPAPERMATPKPLLDVLQRKLNPALAQRTLSEDDDAGAVTPVAMKPVIMKPLDAPKVAAPHTAPAKPVVVAKSSPPAPTPRISDPVAPVKVGTSGAPPKGYVPSVPAPVGKVSHPAEVKPVDKTSEAKPAPKPEKAVTKPTEAAPPKAAATAALTIQAGAFSDKGRAQTVADKVGGTLQKAGAMWRVRVGSYDTHASAEAALAKVKSAGYSDARIQRAQ